MTEQELAEILTLTCEVDGLGATSSIATQPVRNTGYMALQSYGPMAVSPGGWMV